MRRLLSFALFFPLIAAAQKLEQKPETPVEKWSGKTIMLIAAHADDDTLSHGTFALLQAHGIQVYVVTLTTGNVGTQDPNLSSMQLAQIRRQEELLALAELGITGDHYINLGHDDGLLEFEESQSRRGESRALDSSAPAECVHGLGSYLTGLG
jgi:LmbE family N-acetylglucosaminyl deacetylase